MLFYSLITLVRYWKFLWSPQIYILAILCIQYCSSPFKLIFFFSLPKLLKFVIFIISYNNLIKNPDESCRTSNKKIRGRMKSSRRPLFILMCSIGNWVMRPYWILLDIQYTCNYSFPFFFSMAHTHTNTHWGFYLATFSSFALNFKKFRIYFAPQIQLLLISYDYSARKNPSPSHHFHTILANTLKCISGNLQQQKIF